MTLLGKIVKGRGNKGEVVVASPLTDVYALKEGEVVLLVSEKYRKQFQIEYVKEIKGTPVIRFVGIDTINDALRLVGYSVYKTGSNEPGMLPATSEPDETGSYGDGYYAGDSSDDSIDEFVVKDTGGNIWGCVTHIEEQSLNKLLEVVSDDGDVFYVPFTDAIVREINHRERIIIIDPPEGLKELNQ